MLRNALITGLLAVTLTGAVSSAQGVGPQPVVNQNNPNENRPQLSLERMDHNFGDIFDHESVETTFKFTNTGSAELIITDIKASCGCTVPKLDKYRYAPGESGEIRVLFNPSKKQGPQNQSIRIWSNDPDVKIHTITVNANVEPVLIMTPPYAQFSSVQKGTQKQVSLTVSGRGEDFKVTRADVQNLSEHIVINMSEPVKTVVNGETRSEVRIDIVALPSLPVGRFNDLITLRTNDDLKPTATVTLAGIVQGDLFTDPQRLGMGRLNAGERFTQKLRVTNRSGSNFRVLEVKPDQVEIENFEYLVRPVNAANQHAWDIIINGSVPSDSRLFRGDFVIKTDVAAEEELRIPFYGSVVAQQYANPQSGVQAGRAGR